MRFDYKIYSKGLDSGIFSMALLSTYESYIVDFDNYFIYR